MFILFPFPRGELDYQVDIVGLYLCLVGGTATAYLTAFLAFMYNYVALFCIGLGAYRFKRAAAFAQAVARIYIYMHRPKAKRAMIS
jgi:hypothetical protein